MYLNHQEFDRLPSRPGIYKFQNKEGEIIYIGKAKNVKKRVLSHFHSKLVKEVILCNETFSIDFELTGNELIALLLEADLIQKHQPKHNMVQKKSRNAFYIHSAYTKTGILQMTVEELPLMHVPTELFFSKSAAKRKLEMMCEEFNLCPKFSGLQRKKGRCALVKFPFCKGVCSGTEDVSSYNIRAEEALASLKASTASFIIQEKGRQHGERCLVLVLNGVYQGFCYVDGSQQICGIEELLEIMEPRNHNYFIGQILSVYRKKNPFRIMNLDAKTT
ncbi:GIY-YIG nuclease family protein [uncultured Kriegella sp.]|uniref:GIY-YIG nuclease family protein n=1 Tax=uncultured Kriegella sp. TaxID=1798910 RepID=UPI0030D76322|tara:strand:+ start:27490 stop:28317 length:828 start_codon:yes stop_codon:yes gene_type:complete